MNRAGFKKAAIELARAVINSTRTVYHYTFGGAENSNMSMYMQCIFCNAKVDLDAGSMFGNREYIDTVSEDIPHSKECPVLLAKRLLIEPVELLVDIPEPLRLIDMGRTGLSD